MLVRTSICLSVGVFILTGVEDVSPEQVLMYGDHGYNRGCPVKGGEIETVEQNLKFKREAETTIYAIE